MEFRRPSLYTSVGMSPAYEADMYELVVAAQGEAVRVGRARSATT
jgi:hypothetical protein